MSDRKSIGMLGKPVSEVRTGQLGLIVKGALKKTKTFHAILSSSSQSGVARLELYENIKHSLSLQPSLMLVGQDVIKVEKVTMLSKETRNALLISTKDQHYTFFAKNALDCDMWVKDIQNTLLERQRSSSKIPDAIIEENEIYLPSDEVMPQIDEFTVTIDKATRNKIGVDGKMKIVVANGSITIISLSGKKIVQWAIQEIRRFGRTPETFFLVAGRKSTLGEGEFGFLTEQGDSIMASVDRHRKKRELMGGQGNTSSPTVSWPQKAPPSTKMQPQAWNTECLYEPLEDILSSSHSTDSSSTQKRPSTQIMPRTFIKSDCPGSPTQKELLVSKPFPSYTHASSVGQHTSRPPPEKGATHQAQAAIYSEPELIKEAWKYHGRNDEDTDSSLYSGLTYSQSNPTKEKEENHYWDGSMLHQHEHEQEPLYAKIDPSKKINKQRK